MKAVQETSLSLLNFPRRHSDHDKERRVARARQTIALQHSTTTTGIFTLHVRSPPRRKRPPPADCVGRFAENFHENVGNSTEGGEPV
jgi:hypothetical protein